MHQEDRLGFTALHLACLHGNVEIVRLLLHHGCCPNGTDHPNAPSPLMLALGKSNETVQVLLHEGADLNIRFANGNNAFFHAVSIGDINLLKYILSVVKPDFSHTNDSNYNVFHCIFFPNCFVGSIFFRSFNPYPNHCEMLEQLIEFVKQNQECLHDFKIALNQALPYCVRNGCLNCLKVALPYIDTHYEYDVFGCGILEIAMSNHGPFKTDGPNWTLNPKSQHGLDSKRVDMVTLLLLEKGASLLTTKKYLLCKEYGALPASAYDTLDIYIVFIKAWGGWHPRDVDSNESFLRFICTEGMENAARLLCLAGYTPSVSVLENAKPENIYGVTEDQLNNMKEEIMKTYMNTPRPLSNLAVIAIRQCLLDNILFKVKLLMLPDAMKKQICLAGIHDVPMEQKCYSDEDDDNDGWLIQGNSNFIELTRTRKSFCCFS